MPFEIAHWPRKSRNRFFEELDSLIFSLTPYTNGCLSICKPLQTITVGNLVGRVFLGLLYSAYGKIEISLFSKENRGARLR